VEEHITRHFKELKVVKDVETITIFQGGKSL